MKKGFTLIELIIVIIIVGILATIGMAQYTKIVEKSRWAEARSVLGSLRTLGNAYYLEFLEYATDITSLDNALPNTTTGCNTSYWFQYSYTGGTGTATRCGAEGKVPPGTTDSLAKTKTLSVDGVWGGTAGTSY